MLANDTIFVFLIKKRNCFEVIEFLQLFRVASISRIFLWLAFVTTCEHAGQKDSKHEVKQILVFLSSSSFSTLSYIASALACVAGKILCAGASVLVTKPWTWAAKPHGDWWGVKLNFPEVFAARKFPCWSQGENGGSSAKYCLLMNPAS